jgi:hypothetical protein
LYQKIWQPMPGARNDDDWAVMISHLLTWSADSIWEQRIPSAKSAKSEKRENFSAIFSLFSPPQPKTL